MQNRIKLVYTTCGDHLLLFNLKEDPMEQKDLSGDPAWQEKKQELFALLLAHVKETAPQVLEEIPSGAGSSCRFKTTPAPRFPGDMPGRWFGFHYHDYSVDTFH